MLRRATADSAGFTLVELVAVMLVVAVLSAIAVPTYLNHRRDADHTVALADVRSAAAMIPSVAVDARSGSYAEADGWDAGDLSAAGLDVHGFVSMDVAAGAESYCLLAVHDSDPDRQLRFESRRGVIEIGPTGSLTC